MTRPMWPTIRRIALVLTLGAVAALATGCPFAFPDFSSGPIFNNPDDADNEQAGYIGAAACAACHPDTYATASQHAHAQALMPIQGVAPEYPAIGTRAGVPDPPAGKTWNDVSYVISGYTLGAFFVDAQGYIMTDGVEGVNTQWNLAQPVIRRAAGFVEYKPAQAAPLEYAYDCFRCHTTGPVEKTAAQPQSQDGRPGIGGTWAEAGIKCEACHGPGSNHAPDPEARSLFVDPTNDTCARCHLEGTDPDVIVASAGYVNPNTQIAELRASGGHSDFTCTLCHDPHVSTVYADGLRNTCAVCHTDQNMALHAGFRFVLGDYEEELSCESCHMTYTGLSMGAAAADAVGAFGGRAGDVRSHIFRIDPERTDFTAMFSADLSRVLTDAEGRAAVSLDFVCGRCHTGLGNAFLITPAGAGPIATDMHTKAAAP
jgi:hypothetical protein